MNLGDLETYSVTERVRDFYDRHPYPPPVADLDEYRQQWQDEDRRRVDFHLFWPSKPYHEQQQILVAGCGTSQAARYALRYPAAQIVGIDISSTSIQETEKLIQRYKLNNLELVELPIEQAEDLDQQFDRIICTGVLHHLPDPPAGLRALHQVLKPDGALHLMVYATYGRTGIHMIQDYARLAGVGDTDAEINDFAKTLLSLPRAHPLAPLLAGSPDFRTRAGLADALLNPQDRTYTVPQLMEIISSAGLRFGRWLRQAPYLPQCGRFADSPHTSRLARLPLKVQYTAMELLRGIMLRHSAIILRDDSTPDQGLVNFDQNRWQDYIPIRRSGSISIRDNLPPNAAAVLLNQNHTFEDLFLPIDKLQKHLYEAIDGQHSVGQIIHSVISSGEREQPISEGRNFFQLLWWYDQVVFDTSSAAISNAQS